MAPNSQDVVATASDIRSENTPTVVKENVSASYLGGLITFRTALVWPNVIFFAVVHAYGFYHTYLGIMESLFGSHPFLFIYVYMTGYFASLGITVGAHRLWTHKSYRARRPMRVLLMILSSMAGQNCIHTWVKEHRLHHKYADTDGDPHNASRGLFFSHVGWLMMKKHPDLKAKWHGIPMADIESDPVVMFQKRHFKKLFFFFGIVVPALVPYFVMGLTLQHSFGTCVSRLVMLWNMTWTVNSLAHYYGPKPYDKDILSTECLPVSIWGYGEGWHNYHHAFPWDYKCSEFGKFFNSNRDWIDFAERIGQAYDLKEASHDMVEKVMGRKGDGSPGWNMQNPRLKHLTPDSVQTAAGW